MRNAIYTEKRSSRNKKSSILFTVLIGFFILFFFLFPSLLFQRRKLYEKEMMYWPDARTSGWSQYVEDKRQSEVLSVRDAGNDLPGF